MQKNQLKNLFTTIFTFWTVTILFISWFSTSKMDASSPGQHGATIPTTLDSVDKSMLHDSLKIPSFNEMHPRDGLAEALLYYDIDHPEIVYAQAILETGNFKSHGARVKHNLFGLMKKNRLRTFNHWEESVKYYKEHIQNRYNGKGDYYAFLKRIRYASDPTYTNKLKKIVRETSYVWEDMRKV